MSNKRQATSDLNHNNWDEKDEPEERGTFAVATSDELNKRVIKKARRKVTDAADDDSKKCLFSGFGGFKKNTANIAVSTGSNTFSFLGQLPSATSSTTGETTSYSNIKPTFNFTGTSASIVNATDNQTPAAAKATSIKATFRDSSNYYAKLKDLNQDVSDWIRTHVDNNPLCILTPIFKDYEKYLDELQKEDKSTGEKAMAAGSGNKLPTASNTQSTISSFQFSASPPATTTIASNVFTSVGKPAETTKTNGFTFALKYDGKPMSIAPTPAMFSFGNTTTGTTSSTYDNKPSTSTGFGFTPGAAAAFAFGSIQPPALPALPANDDEDDEEDKPKQNEFKQVIEDDAFYSKKCKVFVKKESDFTDRGVGTLFLKSVEDGKKTQLLIRADTNLGNILINLILSSSIPTQRMGKNNVMLVGLPLPDTGKAMPILIRVKTAEEADELLETIEKYKK